MKLQISRTAIVLTILVTLAFVAIAARWMIVADLAEDVDTHRLTAEEETALLVKRAKQAEEAKEAQQ
jgi:hypothetical protein